MFRVLVLVTRDFMLAGVPAGIAFAIIFAIPMVLGTVLSNDILYWCGFSVFVVMALWVLFAGTAGERWER